MSLWGRVVMAIEIAVDFRRLTRAGVWSLAGILTLSAAAGAQATCGTATTPPCVSVGSLIPIPYDTAMNQIYKILFYKGNALALDAGADVLYQLTPGATSWNNISGAPRNSTLLGGANAGGYNSQSMAIDAQGTIYIADTYPPTDAANAFFWRIPYDPVENTWHLSTANAWGGNILDPANGSDLVAESGQGTVDVQFENSPAMDGSGTLYFGTNQNQIYSIQVDNQGNSDLKSFTATTIVNATEGGGVHMAIDEVGNIYFVEGHALTNATRATGIWFIPAGSPPITGTGGTAEAKMIRVDYAQSGSSAPVVYAGVTLDAAGNLYMTSESNTTYNETFAGIWEMPNVCGPGAVTAANVNTCMDDGEIQLLAPISSNQPLAIDSRGNFWVPTYQGYSPSGENAQVGVFSIAVFAPGILDLDAYTPGAGLAGPTPTGTTSLPGNLYMSFNGTFMPTAFQFSSASGGASLQFGTTQTNPIPGTGSTPTVPCNGTSGTPPVLNTYKLTNSCLLWVTVTPTVPGPVSGLLTIYGTTPGVTTPVIYSVYVHGTGQGGGAAFLNSPQLNTLAAPTGFTAPGQVASDSIGDIWVADPGAKKVLYFPAGSSSATGQSIGTGLSDPTGVAVDGAGDIYIADWNPSKKKSTVYEIPWVPNDTPPAYGTLGGPSGTTQIKLATGFGNNLNLAVDGIGNVYVADPDNARVVKIPTPAEADLVVNPGVFGDTTTTTTVTVGSGFAAPSAVAVDPSGDVFVADGTSLYEITVFPFSAQSTITSALPGNVNGMAIDASGSLIASIGQQGLYRIPNFLNGLGVGSLSVNSASLIDTSFTLLSPSSASAPTYCGGPGACSSTVNVISPGGVALDQEGNIYVADMTNNVPNLYEMNVTQGFANYGVGLTPQTSYEQDLDLFNIGNMPLKLTPNPPSFSGPDAANDYTLTPPSAGTTCDTSGATAVAVSSSCSLGPTFEGPALPPADLTPNIYQGDSLTVPTNASNIGGAGTATATLFAATINNLETTLTTPVFNATALTFPGSGTVTVTVAPSPTSTYNYAPAAVGASVGSVVLTLSCSSMGCTQPAIVETATAYVTSSGPGDVFSASATFNNLPTLDGGGYNVVAAYQGSVLNLTGKSTGNTSFTIQRATPVITLSEPLGVAPNATNGVYYVLQGGTGTLQANVSSKVGIPSNDVPVTLTDATQGSLGSMIYTSGQNWTFDTGPLRTDSYSVIASWAGDINYSPVQTTVPVTFQLTPPTVLLTASPASLTTPAGTPVAATISIQALVGFTAPSGANIICNVSKLGAPNFPPDSECTFSASQPFICPPTPTNGPCTAATTVLTLNTNVPVNILSTASNTQRPQHVRSPLALAGIFGLGLLGLALRRRAIFNRYLLNIVCLALFFAGTVMGITSCTNDSYSAPIHVPTYTTPAGTYNISVQVTNIQTGALESLPFTLKVTVQ